MYLYQNVKTMEPTMIRHITITSSGIQMEYAMTMTHEYV